MVSRVPCVRQIKWKNYDSDHNTWEPESNLQCDDLVAAYDEQHPRRQGRSKKRSRTAESSSDSDSDREEPSSSSAERKREAGDTKQLPPPPSADDDEYEPGAATDGDGVKEVVELGGEEVATEERAASGTLCCSSICLS